MLKFSKSAEEIYRMSIQSCYASKKDNELENSIKYLFSKSISSTKGLDDISSLRKFNMKMKMNLFFKFKL